MTQLYRTGPGRRRTLATLVSLVMMAGLLVNLGSANAAEGTTYSLLGGAPVSDAKADREVADLELGMTFSTSVAGHVRAIRFLKAPTDKSPTHRVTLWDSAGRKLAAATSKTESKSGWQTVQLSKAVKLAQGAEYVVSYRTNRYMATNEFFSTPRAVGPLSAPAAAGVYKYGGGFPSTTFEATNYWVDVLFRTGAAAPPATAPPTTAPTTTAPPATAPTTTPTTPTTTVPTTTPPTSVQCAGERHMPGGPDGMGGCWPSEGNTGVPSGTTLSKYTGPCTITAAGTVVDSKLVDCNLQIKAKDVVITKSKINGAVMIDSSDCAAASYKVSDSTIHVGDINLRGLMSCNFTATRVNVSGGQSMAWCDSCTIQDSYLHSPLEDPAGAAANHAAHNSTVRMAKYAVIKHNTLWCAVKEYPQPDGKDTSGCSANQTGYSHDGAAPHNSTVEGNLFMPTTGGYCAYGGSTTGALSSVHHIVFKDNVFKRGTNKGQHGYTCGYYGAVTSFDGGRPGNQWVNNRWDDGTILLP